MVSGPFPQEGAWAEGSVAGLWWFSLMTTRGFYCL